jgi:hypothetical protein
METVQTIEPTLDAVVEEVRRVLGKWWALRIDKTTVRVIPYCYDERIDWNTYMVMLDKYGVFGFTDGPVD